jgi:hypothetical protein
MDSYGDGNTYRGVVCRDSKMKTFEWGIDMRKDVIDKYIKNLYCCGNCKHYLTPDCPMREEIPDLSSFYNNPDSYEICDNWTFDSKTYKERMIA